MTVIPVVSREADSDQLSVTLNVTEDLEWFRGHFPEMPVLPGIVQLHWAVQLSKDHFGLQGEPLDIQRLKFKSVASPPVVIELTLSRTSDTDVWFAFTGSGLRYSEGRVRFPGKGE